MKPVRLLFALYVLFLTVYPCSDSNTCVDERKTGSAFVNVADHPHTSEEQDFCTPFCICACCAAHIQLNHLSGISIADLVHNTKVTTPYFEKPLLINAKAIWQPPKLS